MTISEPLVPLDDEILRRLLWSIGSFREPTNLDRDWERQLEQSASWDAGSRKTLSDLRARRERERREHDEGLAKLRHLSGDPRVMEYFATELKSEDHLKRRTAVRLLGTLERRDWVVAALTDVAQNDPDQARRSTSSIEYTDPDVAEMYMETYYPLREEAQTALGRLR